MYNALVFRSAALAITGVTMSQADSSVPAVNRWYLDWTVTVCAFGWASQVASMLMVCRASGKNRRRREHFAPSIPWRAAAFGCVFEKPLERAMRKRFRDALAAKAASQEGRNNDARVPQAADCLLCDQRYLGQQQQVPPRPEPVHALHPSAAADLPPLTTATATVANELPPRLLTPAAEAGPPSPPPPGCATPESLD